MSDISELGDLLVSLSVAGQDSADLTAELRSIHDEFISNRDAEQCYFRMGFLATKAIARCSQLEGSDVGNRSDGSASGAGDSGRAGSPADGPLSQPRSAPAYTPPPPSAD